MKIHVVTPSVPQVLTGNVITAVRYARILRRLGHRVEVSSTYDGGGSDVLVALHARRSHEAIRRWTTERPDAPVVLVLTGTDLYQDIRHDPAAQQSLDLASRLVVLQRMGVEELPAHLRPKTRVIYQSAPTIRARARRPRRFFRVCVIGHLRPEKDPLRTALAARFLPPWSRTRVIHIGAALTPELEADAQEESQRNPRYRWVGPRPHWRTRQTLAASHLMAITSLMEGSSNVLCEALAQERPTPVVASRISGLIGTLGEDYAGYFSVGEAPALAGLLERAECDPDFYQRLVHQCMDAAPLVSPERELESWSELLAEVRGH